MRLESMVLMGADLPLPSIRRQIASAIDIIVHLGRLRDRSRRVLSVMEMTCDEDGEIRLHPLYLFQETGEENGRVLGNLEKTGELMHTDKLRMAGK